MDKLAAEARYHTLFEKSSDGILIAEAETQAIRYANPAACRMFGYPESALRTMHVKDLSPRDAQARTLAEFESLARGRETLLQGTPRMRKDGSIIFVDISAAPITIDGCSMVAGFFRDVTKSTLAESALKTSEARYRRLFEASRDGILILDGETGRIVDANPFMTALTGYSREDFVGEFLWEIGPFKDTGASKASFAQLQAQEFIRYDDLPLATRAGGTVDVEFVSNVYAVGDRNVIQCNIRDISVRKRAEDERRRLATAIEQADEMVLVTDTDGAIMYVNPAFESVTGYSRAEVLGRNPRFLKSGDPRRRVLPRAVGDDQQRQDLARTADQQEEGRHALLPRTPPSRACATPPGTSRATSPSSATSPRVSPWRRSSCRRRRWRPSAGSPGASPTTSTTPCP